ncbi:hypothetical protein BK645_10100 [Pseudomonas protegens]|nr:hypothetical protein BK645_10100 [Pseudomonas protegens]ROM36945.1 hypothetical protein BK646_18145 [Pseudomonas protegens]
MISVPRDELEFALGFKCHGHKNRTDQAADRQRAMDQMRALLAKPEPAAERNKYASGPEFKVVPLYTHPAEQPSGTTSDKYKAELYDEVWQLARDMGFGNVTDALMKLQRQLQGEPLYQVSDGVNGWDDVDLLRYSACCLDPEEYICRVLYTHPTEQPAQKYDDTLLPFMELMRRELHANSHKGGRPEWLKMTASTALEEIAHHFNKLDEAVGARDNPQIQEYAADIANICMMLLDICGVLSLAEQAKPIISTSDTYRAELYDEVWQLARDMGFGNVTDALMKLQGNKTR